MHALKPPEMATAPVTAPPLKPCEVGVDHGPHSDDQRRHYTEPPDELQVPLSTAGLIHIAVIIDDLMERLLDGSGNGH